MTSESNAPSPLIPFGEAAVVASGLVITTAILGDSLPATALAVLYLVVKLLWTVEGPPALLFAILFQWSQATLGVFYFLVFGRKAFAMEASDYRPIVLIGLGCVLSLAMGLRFGIWLVSRLGGDRDIRPVGLDVPWTLLIGVYVASIVFQGSLMQVAFDLPLIRQILVTVTAVRLAVLYLVLRRFIRPTFQWYAFGGLVVFEVLLGFTGFSAGFREPLVLGAMALIEIFDRRKVHHWLMVGAVSVTLGATGVVWMGIRDAFRGDWVAIETFSSDQRARFDRASALTSDFLKRDATDLTGAVDALVDRLWSVYYPALAVARVPAVLPHTDGALLLSAVERIIMPRFLFPDKAALPSESEMVRKYAGVHVAGAEQGTSIAFGYPTESYVDFGLPYMFVPIFLFGVAMGIAYLWLLHGISSKELAIPLVAVVFWVSLFQFERSWAKMLGDSLSLLVYLSLPVGVIDRYFVPKRFRSRGLDADVDAAIGRLPAAGRG